MRKTARKSGNAVFVSLVIIIPILVYLLSFSSVIYNKPFIEKQMQKHGMFRHSLEINSHVIDYLRDKNKSSVIGLDIFDEKEKSHLLDVKKLVHRLHDVLFLLLALFFLLAYIYDNGDWGKVLLYSGMIAAAIPVVLYFIPFDFVFTAFHNAFFACGTWVFEPGSALIQLYPFGFWYDAAFGMLIRGFFAGWILVLIGLGITTKK